MGKTVQKRSPSRADVAVPPPAVGKAADCVLAEDLGDLPLDLHPAPTPGFGMIPEIVEGHGRTGSEAWASSVAAFPERAARYAARSARPSRVSIFVTVAAGFRARLDQLAVGQGQEQNREPGPGPAGDEPPSHRAPPPAPAPGPGGRPRRAGMAPGRARPTDVMPAAEQVAMIRAAVL